MVAFFVANDFITIWLGQEYVLDNYTVFFFALNVYVFILMYPISVLYGALGYFKYDKIMICISAAINIVISVLLVFKFGVFGVLVGTNVSLNIYWICRTIILYKRYYEFKSNCYLSMILRCLLTTCFSVLLIAILNNWLNFYLSELFSFLIKGTIYSISVLAINVLFFYRTSGFKYMIYLIKRFLNKRRKA